MRPNYRIRRGVAAGSARRAGESILELCRSGLASEQLFRWARRDRRGKAFDSSAEFMLPSGAGYAPDAAWVSSENLARLSKEQHRKFLALVPEFVVEVMSPSDRPRVCLFCDHGPMAF